MSVHSDDVPVDNKETHQKGMRATGKAVFWFVRHKLAISITPKT